MTGVDGALRIAREAVALRDAGVGWPTVRHLAVVVRLAGVRAVLELGSSVVEGPDGGVDAVRDVLERLEAHPSPHIALARMATVLRSVSVPTGAAS